MPELKAKVIQQPALSNLESAPERLGKRWKVALHIENGRDKGINRVVESYYREILLFAKNIIATLPESYQRTVFEKDYSEDSRENSFAIHSFISPSFYWYLECDFAYHYRVEYDFFNCPFEEQIRAKMSGMFTLLRYSEQRHLKPNCEDYLKRVLRVQDENYKLLL